MLIIGPALTNIGRKNIPGFCYKIEAEFKQKLLYLHQNQEGRQMTLTAFLSYE